MKSTLRAALAATAAFAAIAGAAPAFAQAEPFIGQVTLFGMNWCPRNWLPANGQTMSIAQNSALFSLFGTQYGGDGVATFALPNLQGRAPVSASSSYPVGTAWGNSQVTMTIAQMPAHTHVVLASSAGPTVNSPSGASLATFPGSNPIYAAPSSTPDIPMNPAIVSSVGNNQPIPTQSPVLAMIWCVSMQGVFPSRP